MGRKRPEPVLYEDGDISDKWRVAFPECLSIDGWIPRTDYWMVGITLRPGVDPATLRREVCDALHHPGGTRLDGTIVEPITWEPHEIRLVASVR